MTKTTHVILVTGFLGSGKTSFLNHAVRELPADIKVAVLMNEFADIGVDAALITRRNNLEVIEVNKGSIFCICAKKDFLLGLAHIADHVAPDILLIEATGVANPLDIHKDLALECFKSRFAFAFQICLVDTPNFEAAYHVFNAVESQIISSDFFILNKMDLADPLQKRNTEALIAAHRDAPVFLEAVNARVPIDRLFEKIINDRTAGTSDTAPIHLEAVETTALELMRHPTATRTPADHLIAVVYRWKGLSRQQMQSLLERLPASILRIKGFVRLDGEIQIVSRAVAEYRIEPVSDACAVSPTLCNRLVLIAAPAAFVDLEGQGGCGLLEKESRHDPVGIIEKMPTL